MSGRFHLQEQEIPDGYQIFEERLEIAGLAFRKKDAAAFANSSTIWLELERDPFNKYDENAIRVIGCSKTVFGTRRRFIGHVPKKVARAVVERGLWGEIKPRLLKTYVGPGGFVEILFQLLGPKGRRKAYSGKLRSRA